MVELIDWNQARAQNVGTPGWHTLAVKVTGEIRRPADRVFVAVEQDPSDGRCHVLIAADIPEVGPDVMTPFELDVRLTLESIRTFVLIGATRSEEISATTP